MSSAGFDGQKETILRNLRDGIDFSPKGCIDAPIFELVNCLNSLPDYCTTSSCSGRISCYRLLGERKGIDWILVRHAEIDVQSVKSCVKRSSPQKIGGSSADDQLTMLKCEGVLLHILARDVEAARALHAIAMAAGFRECGISIGPKKVILAIRTTAFGLELPIAAGDDLLLSDRALDITVAEANKRLRSNFARIDRLLSAIKDHFRWPFFEEIPFKGEGLLMDVTDRWGHVAVASSAGRFAVLGGFGIADSRSNRKTASVVVEITEQGDSYACSACEGDSICRAPIDLMHSAACSDGEVLVVFGGRTSPKEALDTVLFLHKDTLQPLPNHAVLDNGTSPGARWGHSLTYIGHHCFLLVGGRDCHGLCGQAFIFRRQFCHRTPEGINMHEWSWHHISPSPSALGTVALQRFFHASCALDADLTGHEHRLFAGAAAAEGGEGDGSLVFSRVLLHGGLLSLDDSSTDAAFYLVSTSSDPCGSNACQFQVSVNRLAPPRMGIKGCDEEEQSAATAGHLKLDLSRFGHSITNIKSKSLVLSGGATYSSDSYNSTLNEAASLAAGVTGGETAPDPLPVDEQAFLVLDWLYDDDGNIVLVHRNIGLTRLPGAERGRCEPHAVCRCHHQSVLATTAGRGGSAAAAVYVMIGGGALCVGFSPHYCNPLAFRIRWGAVSSPTRDVSPERLTGAAGGRDADMSAVASAVSADNELSWVVLAPKLAVKQIKNILEAAGVISKNKRISTFQAETPGADVVVFSNGTADAIDVRDAIQNHFSDAMAIPVQLDFAAFCRRDTCDKNFEHVARDVCSALATHMPAQYAGVLFLAQQKNRAAKLDIVSGHRRAEELLRAISARNGIPSSEIPNKFEIVGDVLMIPEQCLVNSKWSLDFQSASHFWATLAGWFGLPRVARKARVDPGPKRESHVELLYVSPERSLKGRRGKRQITRQERSDGWVVVAENGIDFGFDICKVMFCSGNNTERMRMGRVTAKNQVIVDLYCGIGYYTMPFLVHAQAAVVHAFEWNINSVASLIVNLSAAGVARERCVLHYGDNNNAVFGRRPDGADAMIEHRTALPLDNFVGYTIRDVATESKEELDRWAADLTDVADRVSLGLLPSSRGGWEAAVRVLSRRGGTLHVHYNVNAADIECWVEEMLATFTSLFRAAGKEMTLDCTHVEKVKSYAPRVFHIVADVTCTPVSH